MPKATVNTQETERFELKTCPGGYVELRGLTYYEMMHRRDIAAKMYQEVQVDPRNRKQRRGKEQTEQTLRTTLDVLNVQIMEYEFSKCIVSHNLEDEDGNLLDFTNPLSFHRLDSRIGMEINRHIEDLTQEDEEDVVPLEKPPTSSSPDGETKLSPITDES
jgi:hypothetical protein